MIPALSQNSLPVGILMNRASFPRLPGDIGNPATFPFAVRYRMVPGTTYHDVVEALQEERLLVPFIAAAQALDEEEDLDLVADAETAEPGPNEAGEAQKLALE